MQLWKLNKPEPKHFVGLHTGVNCVPNRCHQLSCAQCLKNLRLKKRKKKKTLELYTIRAQR